MDELKAQVDKIEASLSPVADKEEVGDCSTSTNDSSSSSNGTESNASVENITKSLLDLDTAVNESQTSTADTLKNATTSALEVGARALGLLSSISIIYSVYSNGKLPSMAVQRNMPNVSQSQLLINTRENYRPIITETSTTLPSQREALIRSPNLPKPEDGYIQVHRPPKTLSFSS